MAAASSACREEGVAEGRKGGGGGEVKEGKEEEEGRRTCRATVLPLLRCLVTPAILRRCTAARPSLRRPASTTDRLQEAGSRESTWGEEVRRRKGRREQRPHHEGGELGKERHLGGRHLLSPGVDQLHRPHRRLLLLLLRGEEGGEEQHQQPPPLLLPALSPLPAPRHVLTVLLRLLIEVSLYQQLQRRLEGEEVGVVGGVSLQWRVVVGGEREHLVVAGPPHQHSPLVSEVGALEPVQQELGVEVRRGEHQPGEGGAPPAALRLG